MPAATRQITPADLIPDAEYARQRKDRRAALLPIKRLRRIELGPVCTFLFETYETMLFQVQEMLLTEKGGADQVPDELAAYNPLIPQGSELVATVMFEIEDPVRREQALARMGGVENDFFVQVGDDRAAGRARGRHRAHAGGRQDLLRALPALSAERRANRPLPRPRHPDHGRLQPRGLQPPGRPHPSHPRGTGEGLRLNAVRL